MKLEDYLENLNIQTLMELSEITESTTFDEDSIVRHLIYIPTDIKVGFKIIF